MKLKVWQNSQIKKDSHLKWMYKTEHRALWESVTTHSALRGVKGHFPEVTLEWGLKGEQGCQRKEWESGVVSTLTSSGTPPTLLPGPFL